MDPGFRLVQRFRGAGIGHLGRDQDLWFVDVAQGDVGKIRRGQGRLVKGQVIGIPAVDHQDMDGRPKGLPDDPPGSHGSRA